MEPELALVRQVDLHHIKHPALDVVGFGFIHLSLAAVLPDGLLNRRGTFIQPDLTRRHMTRESEENT
ncbi:hypothetical protein GCM10023212_23970 [Luteolibacter yonseiensis]